MVKEFDPYSYMNYMNESREETKPRKTEEVKESYSPVVPQLSPVVEARVGPVEPQPGGGP